MRRRARLLFFLAVLTLPAAAAPPRQSGQTMRPPEQSKQPAEQEKPRPSLRDLFMRTHLGLNGSR
ncbi:MAG: hypothetical protein ACJ754_27440 [Pyrinomonadaceae bacterium]